MRGHSDIDEQRDPVSRKIGTLATVIPLFARRSGFFPEEVVALLHRAALSEPSLTDRLADLLVQILDEPLATLPGCPEGLGSTELRLGHYRPDLSALAASLLEEAGR